VRELETARRYVGGAWRKMTASAVAAIRVMGPVFIEK
jgi:hypothetical protein